ncbi:MAG: hypothetical protein KAH97_06685 [Anaerolineales bacterium]|nr:hypothetical protein [Anaerolineales bacterium]
MSLKPMNTVEDNYVEGLTCAVCESPKLSVTHVDAYPDFILCGNCASAFVVEDEGNWIMYGKVSDDFPKTREFAQRQWTWLDAVRQRAQDESEEIAARSTVEPEDAAPFADLPTPVDIESEEITPEEPLSPIDSGPEPIPAPTPPLMDEIAAPEASIPDATPEELGIDEDLIPQELDSAYASPPDSAEALELETTSDLIDEITEIEEPTPPSEIVPEFESVEPEEVFSGLETPAEPVADLDEELRTAEALFPETIEPLLTPDDVPTLSEEIEQEAQVADAPAAELDVVELSRLQQVTTSPEDAVEAPIEESITREPSQPEELGSEMEELPIPEWLEKQPTEQLDDILAIPPFAEATGGEMQVSEDKIIPPFADEKVAPSPIQMPEAEDIGGAGEGGLLPTTEPADFLAPESEDIPSGTSIAEELGFTTPPPEDLEPPDSPELADIDAVELEEVDEPVEEHLLPPWARKDQPTEEPVVTAETVPDPIFQETEEPTSAESLFEPEDETALPAPEYEIPLGEPEEGSRYRVIVEGDALTFPNNVCVHCLQMPVKLAAAVRGTLPDPQQPGDRKQKIFKLPLCGNCENRAKASSEEERSAKLQAHIISGIVAVILIVLVLIFGSSSFSSGSFIGALITIIVGILGYGIPAILLLNRASAYPPPYDAAYVLTTLRVVDLTTDNLTAFEWRNQGYAELFRQVNRKSAQENIARVEDLMVLIEPAPPEPTEEPEPDLFEFEEVEAELDGEEVPEGESIEDPAETITPETDNISTDPD